MTTLGIEVSDALISNYFSKNLVNQLFKILPIWESGEPTLQSYMESLQIEMLGGKAFISAINNDGLFVSLLSILQYLIDNPDTDIPTVKREVFKAISICKKIHKRYFSEVVS